MPTARWSSASEATKDTLTAPGGRPALEARSLGAMAWGAVADEPRPGTAEGGRVRTGQRGAPGGDLGAVRVHELD
eukprot:2934520-Heterocapsa_arctica.AAC.1